VSSTIAGDTAVSFSGDRFWPPPTPVTRLPPRPSSCRNWSS